MSLEPVGRVASASEPGGATAPFGVWERVIAGRYLRARRKQGGVALISVIAFVGIMLAVAVLIIVMSVMNGFRQELISKFLGVEGHVYVAAHGLSPDQVDAIRADIEQVDGVISATPVLQGPGMVASVGDVAPAFIFGVAPEDMENFAPIREGLIAGSRTDFGVGRNGGDHILVAYRLAARFGLTARDDITLVAAAGRATAFGTVPNRKTYEIAGTFSIGMTELDNLYVYMPMEQARLFLGRGDATDTIEIAIDNPDDAERMVRRLREVVPLGVRVNDWRARHQSLVGALVVERNVMRLILMLIVAIAALNIISGLVMLVKNKGRDIAILRTMGATQGSVMRIFVMAGAAIGVLGTLAGLILGVVFCLNIGAIQGGVEAIFGEVFPADIYFLDSLPAEIEWSEVAIVTGWGLLMSCVATLPPAWRAARLDPVEALRYE